MSAQTESAHPAPWRPEDTLASRLLLVRHELHISQREAAERTGLTFGEWQSMENGAAARGLDRKVSAIASGLGVDRNWLMWGGVAMTTSGWSGRSRQPIPTPRVPLAA